MKEVLKYHWKDIALCCLYTVMAIIVYVLLFNSYMPSNLWWITLLVGILVCAIGVVCSIFYVKSCIKERLKKLEEENNKQ